MGDVFRSHHLAVCEYVVLWPYYLVGLHSVVKATLCNSESSRKGLYLRPSRRLQPTTALNVRATGICTG